MNFKVEKRAVHKNIKYNVQDHALAVKFSNHVRKELGDFIKAVIFFGSSAKAQTGNPNRDIDVMLLIDDSVIILSNEVIQAYRIIVQNVATKTSSRLHINTIRLTNFWEYVKAGDPIIVNVLRDGIALYDSGIFTPVQLLLQSGRVRPTKESILSYQSKAQVTISNSKWHINQAIVDLYWASVDAAHAALMSLDIVPPAPTHVSGLIKHSMVRHGLAQKVHADFFDKIYTIFKKIMHREISHITGKEYDALLKETKIFMKVMKNTVDIQLKGQTNSKK